MHLHSSHNHDRKREAERTKRVKAFRTSEKKPDIQLSLPHLEDAYSPPSPPSLFWQDFRSHIGYLSAGDKDIVKRAFVMGQETHKNQKRISGDPYFTHCIAVALSLTEIQADAETLAVAILHDAVEDTPLELSDIERAFTPAIAHLVDGITKLDRDYLPRSPEHDQHVETIRKVFTYMQEDIRIIVVKLYDRLHNMQTIDALRPDKQRRVAQETLQVYAKIASQLCMKQLRDELEFLSLRVLEPQKTFHVRMLREQRLEETNKVIEHVRGLMQPEATLHIDLEFASVPLRWMRLLRHMEKGEDFSALPLSVAIITPSIEDCYRTLYLLHRLWQREILSFDDFINSPQLNGYQALHTTIILQDGRRVRCMIRTKRMDTYATKGILTTCFTERGTDPLSWVASTMTVSRGLSRSEEFWQSLQADILGEMILIHGPDDRVVMVPEGATALDGVFYLFQSEGLRTMHITIDGTEVGFGEQLAYADTINVTFGSRSQARREWLDWVQTGLATAKIRNALSKQSREKKIAVGREMLQEVMTEKRKGLLDEFQEEALGTLLSSNGIQSLDDACIGIAEGRFEADEILAYLFESISKEQGDRSLYAIHLHLRYGDIDSFQGFWNIFQRFFRNIKSVRMWFSPFGQGIRCLFFASLSRNESAVVLKSLRSFPFISCSIDTLWARIFIVTGLAFMMALWSLDPIIARMLIEDGVSPYDLTALRFIVLLFLSGGIVAFRSISRRKSTAIPVQKLAVFRSALFLSAIGLFFTALCTYIALQYISASTYIAFVLIGTITMRVPIPFFFGGKKPISRSTFALAVAFILSVFLLPTMQGSSLFTVGHLAALGAAVAFSLYSLAAEYYQVHELVSKRYPTFLFLLAIFTFLLSAPLLVLRGLPLLSSPFLWPSILFIFFFTGAPYVLLYLLMKFQGAQEATRYLPIELSIIVLIEYLASGTLHWFTLVPAVLAIAWVVVGERKDSAINPNHPQHR